MTDQSRLVKGLASLSVSIHSHIPRLKVMQCTYHAILLHDCLDVHCASFVKTCTLVTISHVGFNVEQAAVESSLDT